MSLNNTNDNQNPFINMCDTNIDKKFNSFGYQFKGNNIIEKFINEICFVITSSPEFKELSLEELRYNDYMLNRTDILPQQPIINKSNDNNCFFQTFFRREEIYESNNSINQNNSIKCSVNSSKNKTSIIKYSQKSNEEERNYFYKENINESNNNNKKSYNNCVLYSSNNSINSYLSKNNNYFYNKNSRNYNNNNNNELNSLTIKMDKFRNNKINIEINSNKINISVNSKINIDIQNNSFSINTKDININGDNDKLLINTNYFSKNNTQKIKLLKDSDNIIEKSVNNSMMMNYKEIGKKQSIFDTINSKDNYKEEESKKNEIIKNFKESRKNNDNKFKKNLFGVNPFLNIHNNNLKNSFQKKSEIKFLDDSNEEKIKINCHMSEPYSVSFMLETIKNMKISKLKKIIYKELVSKIYNHVSFDIHSLILMKKNCKVIKEIGTVKDADLSDEDDIYIVLKEILYYSSSVKG